MLVSNQGIIQNPKSLPLAGLGCIAKAMTCFFGLEIPCRAMSWKEVHRVIMSYSMWVSVGPKHGKVLMDECPWFSITCCHSLSGPLSPRFSPENSRQKTAEQNTPRSITGCLKVKRLWANPPYRAKESFPTVPTNHRVRVYSTKPLLLWTTWPAVCCGALNNVWRCKHTNWC